MSQLAAEVLAAVANLQVDGQNENDSAGGAENLRIHEQINAGSEDEEVAGASGKLKPAKLAGELIGGQGAQVGENEDGV